MKIIIFHGEWNAKLFIMDLDRNSAQVYGLIIVGTQPNELTSSSEKYSQLQKFANRELIQGILLYPPYLTTF